MQILEKDLIKQNNNKIFKTGDIGKFDEDGFYYITGRINRYIKLFGNRVNLDDIEQMLITNSIENVCWGREDELFIIVKNLKYRKKIKELIKKKTSININYFKIIKLKTFPRTPSGKISYKQIEDII